MILKDGWKCEDALWLNPAPLIVIQISFLQLQMSKETSSSSRLIKVPTYFLQCYLTRECVLLTSVVY
jgi:hypothetical protein